MDEKMTHWMATLPSMLPTAKPLLAEAVKHETTRVCHFRGDCMVCEVQLLSYERRPQIARRTLYGVVGLVRLKMRIWRSAVPATMRGY